MKLFRALFVCFCLAAASLAVASCEDEEVVVPPPPGKEAVDENGENGNENGNENTTPTEEDAARLARLGQTPIVAAYFTEYTPSSEFPTLEDVKCFTHINAGHVRFKNPKTGDGGLEIKSPGTDYMKRLAAYKASYPELKLLLFIGGWGKNADGFSEMAKDDTKRKLFCDECVRLCKELNFDGVDLDWEYPTYSADKGKDGYEGTGADPSDRQNFTRLVKDLREALGPDKLISFAGSAKGEYINNKEVLQYVDFINVMTYSMGDPPSKHNSPLYTSSRFQNKYGGADCIETYHSQGVPYDRMNYGIGFYGHADKTVYGSSSLQYYAAVEALTTGKVNGKDVSGYNIRWWDDASKSCYLGDAVGTMYASYEDVESIKYRVQFIKSKGLLGAFAWEYREDAKDGTLRKALWNMMHDQDPGTNPGTDPGTNPGNEPVNDPGNGPDPSSCKDLGSKETANCYIISAAGNYKFKAVKGNSTSSVGTIGKMELLWETSEGMLSGLGHSNGVVTFSTPSTLVPGNALVAAKDQNGKILWSWHIWIPKTEIGSGMYDLSWYSMLSRNLGALEDASATAGADSYGLLYQWGRKDPFPCTSPADKKSGTMTMDETIQNPTTFAANNGTWMTNVDKTVWGDGSTKTQYDPCPPGYKVPMREDVTVIFKTDALSGEKGWQYASGYAFATGDPQTWFPYSGYIDVNGSYTGSGSSTKIWNSHMDTANNQGYGIFLSGETSSRSSQKAAQGGSVRCISLEQAPFTNEPGMPVMGSYTRVVFDASSVVELSGLCFSKDGDFIWGVGDEGCLYKFTNIDGDVTNIQSSKQWTYDADMEGVTIDPSTGNLYLAIEPKRVYRVDAPNYNGKTTLFDVEEAADMGNSGMEGIAWHKGDLYVGSQSGATLWCYTVSGTKKWKKQLGSIAPGITEVGDLFYDAETDLLWVSDSEACKLFVFDGDVTKLKAIYSVSSVGNAESVLVDHQRNCVWVGDDGSTSKIYKYSFTGL